MGVSRDICRKTLRFQSMTPASIVNVTVEAMAHYLLERVLAEFSMGDLVELELFVTSGEGQMSSACWRAT